MIISPTTDVVVKQSCYQDLTKRLDTKTKTLAWASRPRPRPQHWVLRPSQDCTPRSTDKDQNFTFTT